MSASGDGTADSTSCPSICVPGDGTLRASDARRSPYGLRIPVCPRGGMIAQAIHNRSSRRGKSCVVINCRALPRELVQSELFGCTGGAFTGASRQGNPGKFELADGGTIFLDETGEMPLDAQLSLLRLLQNGEATRIGASAAHKVDVRIIAASNRDLRESVAQRVFRENLFYRLNVFSLRIPPLSERKEDIPLLCSSFLTLLGRKHPACRNRVLSQESLQYLVSRSWPGKVRELEHAIERAAFAAQGSVIQPLDFPERQLPATETGIPIANGSGRGGEISTNVPQHWGTVSPDAARAVVQARSIMLQRAGTCPGQVAFAEDSLGGEDIGREGVGRNGFGRLEAGTAGLELVDERESIVTALRLARGKVDKAAKLLGTSRSTLYARLARHGLRASEFRTLRLESGRLAGGRISDDGKDPEGNAPRG